MKTKIILILLIYSIHSVGITDTAVEKYLLHDKFREYEEDVKNSKTILPLFNYYSKRLIKEMEFYFQYEDLNKSIKTLESRMKFPQDFKNIAKFIQNISELNGCLLLNGTTLKNDKLSMSIGYTYENRIWKIDSITYHYLENKQPFLITPKCGN